MTLQSEKRLLQAAIVMATIVPLGGGMMGMLEGAGMLERGGDIALDSQVRYLSGLLFGVGLGFLFSLREIEKQSARVSALGGIVIIGGLARLAGAVHDGWPPPFMRFALIMELAVVPILMLWQRRLAKLE